MTVHREDGPQFSDQLSFYDSSTKDKKKSKGDAAPINMKGIIQAMKERNTERYEFIQIDKNGNATEIEPAKVKDHPESDRIIVLDFQEKKIIMDKETDEAYGDDLEVMMQEESGDWHSETVSDSYFDSLLAQSEDESELNREELRRQLVKEIRDMLAAAAEAAHRGDIKANDLYRKQKAAEFEHEKTEAGIEKKTGKTLPETSLSRAKVAELLQEFRVQRFENLRGEIERNY